MDAKEIIARRVAHEVKPGMVFLAIAVLFIPV